MGNENRIGYEVSVSQLRGSPLLKALDLPARRGSRQYSCPFFIPSGTLKFNSGNDRGEYYEHLNLNRPAKNFLSAQIPNAFVVAGSDKGQSVFLIQYLFIEDIKESGDILYKSRVNSLGKKNIEVVVREDRESSVSNVFVNPEKCNVVGTLHIISSGEESRVTYLAREKLNLFMRRDKELIKQNSQIVNLAPNAFMPLSDSIGDFGYIGMYGHLIENSV